MTISVGDTLPDANLLVITDDGPASVSLAEKIDGKKVVIFGVPGAFTGTCSTAHVPSFMRTKEGFEGKGVDEIICVSVNDPFVMQAWAKDTGAADAGLTLLADADGSFTKEIGLAFDAPPVGFHGRSQRYAMLAEGGKVSILNVEEGPGVCEVSAGETLLSEMG